MKKIDSLLSEHSLAKWPSFLEETSGGERVKVRDLYSILRFEWLHISPVRVSRLLMAFLINVLSSNEICSHPQGPSGT